MATGPAVATHDMTRGWAEPCRRAALLVARVLHRVRHAPRALRGLRLSPARPRGFMRPVLSAARAGGTGLVVSFVDEENAQLYGSRSSSVNAPGSGDGSHFSYA